MVYGARRLLLVVMVAAAFCGVVTASAVAGSGRPVITFTSPSPAGGATLTSGSVSFAFTYNRTLKQTHSLVCSLSGPTPESGACDAPSAASGGSGSGVSYSGLANGSYTLTVTATLTDGGTVSATRSFTVNVESQAQIDCQSLGGTYSTDPATDLVRAPAGVFVWSCNGFAIADTNNAVMTLADDCSLTGGNILEYLTGVTPDGTCYLLLP